MVFARQLDKVMGQAPATENTPQAFAYSIIKQLLPTERANWPHPFEMRTQHRWDLIKCIQEGTVRCFPNLAHIKITGKDQGTHTDFRLTPAS